MLSLKEELYRRQFVSSWSKALQNTPFAIDSEDSCTIDEFRPDWFDERTRYPEFKPTLLDDTPALQ